MPNETSDHTQRPPLWIGHVELQTRCLDQSDAFMRKIGMRGVFKSEQVAILELRGGTHLVLVAQEDQVAGNASFDLMVEDIEASHRQYTALGLSPSAIRPGENHRSFEITEPGGNMMVINSSHVSEFPV